MDDLNFEKFEEDVKQRLANFRSRFGLADLFDFSPYPLTGKEYGDINSPADLANTNPVGNEKWLSFCFQIQKLKGSFEFFSKGKMLLPATSSPTSCVMEPCTWIGNGDIVVFSVEANLIPPNGYITTDFLKMEELDFRASVDFDDWDGQRYCTANPERAYCIALVMTRLFGCEPMPEEEAIQAIGSISATNFGIYRWEYQGRDSKLRVEFKPCLASGKPIFDCIMGTTMEAFGPGCGAI